MEEKKNNKSILLGLIVLVLGIGLVVYGATNLMKSKKENNNTNDDNEQQNETDNSNMDGPSITTSEAEVQNWVVSNASLINYFIDFNNNFDLETATEAEISDVFAWYFAMVYDHGEGEEATDSKYTYRYTMPKSDADMFLQNYVGVPVDMVDISLITFSKDFFNFTSDEENFYVEVVATGLDPVQDSELGQVEILSDSQIEVTYGIKKIGDTCTHEDEDCYTKTRKLTLRKADSGFTILKAEDIETKTEDK